MFSPQLIIVRKMSDFREVVTSGSEAQELSRDQTTKVHLSN